MADIGFVLIKANGIDFTAGVIFLAAGRLNQLQ